MSKRVEACRTVPGMSKRVAHITEGVSMACLGTSEQRQRGISARIEGGIAFDHRWPRFRLGATGGLRRILPPVGLVGLMGLSAELRG
jgi:hypothetical protein